MANLFYQEDLTKTELLNLFFPFYFQSLTIERTRTSLGWPSARSIDKLLVQLEDTGFVGVAVVDDYAESER